MTLYDDIVFVYPELANDKAKEFGEGGCIRLQNDSDGKGDYIAKWEYDKPLPAGMKIGKGDLIS